MFFYGPSQRFDTTFNNPSSTYDLPPSSSCYRPSLPTKMRDMGHEGEEKNDDKKIPTITMMMTMVVMMLLNNNTQLHVIILEQEEVEVIEQENNKHI